MVNVVAYQAVNIPHLKELGHRADTGPGNFHDKTATSMIFTQGENVPNGVKVDFHLQGSFQYFFGYPYGGTINRMDVFVDDVLAYRFTGAALGVKQAFAYWQAKDPATAFTAIFSHADQMIGSPFVDLLGGFGGNDYLNGRGGNDRLYGGPGNDILLGGPGNDILTGGPGKDSLDGGAGADTAVWTEKTAAIVVTLNGATFANVKIGAGIEDKVRNVENLRGGAGNDTLTGDANANRLEGNNGGDTLAGLGGADALLGGNGADRLNGGEGNDRLTGGGGGDRFAFANALDAALNLDTVADFVPGLDTLVLDSAIFAGLAAGALDPAAFVNGTAATTAAELIVYDTATTPGTGRLFYDADGNLAGAQVEFARLTGAPALAAGDILVA